MALNEQFRDADHLSLPVPSGLKSGDPVRVGGLNGVLETDRADSTVVDEVRGPAVNLNPDGNATVWLKGAHIFQVSFAVTNVGDPVYIVTSTNALAATDNEGANPLYGHALTTKSATAGPLTVRIAN
jgi:predicted RecA/RadA family phage recombinase